MAFYGSLSEAMVAWMKACREYEEMEVELEESCTWDVDYHLYHHKERMEKAETVYLMRLKEELEKVEITELED